MDVWFTLQIPTTESLQKINPTSGGYIITYTTIGPMPIMAAGFPCAKVELSARGTRTVNATGNSRTTKPGPYTYSGVNEADYDG